MLEMLVALLLINVLSAALYMSLRVSIRARRTSDRSLEPLVKANAAMDVLAGDISLALRPAGVLAGRFYGSDEQNDDGGDGDVLSFYMAGGTGANAENPAYDIRKVELSIETDQDSDESILVRRITSNLLSPRTIEADEQVIARDITQLNFRYFDGDDWVDKWDSSDEDDGLPRAVEISLVVDETQDARGYEGIKAAGVDLDQPGGFETIKIVMLRAWSDDSDQDTSSPAEGMDN